MQATAGNRSSFGYRSRRAYQRFTVAAEAPVNFATHALLTTHRPSWNRHDASSSLVTGNS
jgi:hypothetical protein